MIDTDLKTYPFIPFSSMQYIAVVNNAKHKVMCSMSKARIKL